MGKEDYIKLSDIEVGRTVTRPLLITKLEEKTAKNGNPFVIYSLKDGYSGVDARQFSMSVNQLANSGITEHTIADVQLEVQMFNGGKSYMVKSAAPNEDDSVSISDFIKSPPLSVESMFNEICELLRSCSDDMGGSCAPLSELVIAVLEKYKSNYLKSSAAISMHHNMMGGLIYHSYRMVKAADALCNVYTSLDRELMLCGTAIHDIGKLWEYDTDDMGEAQYTAEGTLFGHLYMGATIVQQFSERKGYNKEKVRMLKHMLLSHHGTREFGAVVLPATPEAFALSCIDNLDAKLYVYEDQYASLEKGSIGKEWVRSLETRVYKPDL